MKSNHETYLFLTWATALVATAGSLFFSEVLKYEPCELCWYQRILMYPLVFIYGAALVKRNLEIAIPGMILSGIGMLVSIYHYSIQKVPGLSDGGACGLVPCNAQYVNYFGFVTIPFLAGLAFIIIFITHGILLMKRRRS
ncbi:disulfide oxidoreductase [Halobacillus mangrovi]|uniref:Probable disulfide formation protein n=1 Tax=Halobacillus mangrovi TaxID=402384 RepID=A0A1W5ZXS3_9BACI|nr:disulfide oxidoreductase [Halobacillus mangrovi]ARI78092.1 disulfide bond formation protein B [Halobacillus mangrovi]